MHYSRLAIILLFSACCAGLHAGEKPAPETPAVTNPPTKGDPDKKQLAKLKPLTEKEQSQLLTARLDGGMGYDFVNFSNMFIVKSQIALGRSVGLMTESADIQKVKLQSPFPESYQPTLRQFLDAIALQTSSEWKYDANAGNSSKPMSSKMNRLTGLPSSNSPRKRA